MATFNKMTLTLASLVSTILASSAPTKMTTTVTRAIPAVSNATARWYFGTTGRPYYTYVLHGADWIATFVVVDLDSDCFVEKYQASTSVYQNSYTKQCHAERATQVAFLEQTFAASKAEWKFLQLHHGSPSSRNTAASSSKTATTTVSRTSTIITRTLFSPAARGIPRLGTVTTGCRWAPYTKWLGANSQSAANGFVTMDISREEVNVEYYAWDMKFGGGDLYPIKNDMTPSYSFKIKSHAW
ncbi:purple acid phosphatase 4 [Aspergillus lentulus]|nr:purple acid phosphatase 4 [Aspergillus lentulus]